MLETLFLSYANNSLIENPENLHKIFHEIFLSVCSGFDSGDCNSDFWLDTKDALFELDYAEKIVDAVIAFGTINDAEKIKRCIERSVPSNDFDQINKPNELIDLIISVVKKNRPDVSKELWDARYYANQTFPYWIIKIAYNAVYGYRNPDGGGCKHPLRKKNLTMKKYLKKQGLVIS